MKIKVTPSLPESDLVLMRWHLAKAVARISECAASPVLSEMMRGSAICGMFSIYESEFAAGTEPLTPVAVQALVSTGLARWRPGDCLGVDESVMRAADIECTRFDYASRWN